MQPLRVHTGLVAPLPKRDVDTDQIIPKQFLKRIERSGYGEFLFYDWRFHADGRAREDFVLNQPAYAGASILAAGENFGCGSSREHAAWALLDYGFRVVLAPSFADIFAMNCKKNGIAAIAVPQSVMQKIFSEAASSGGCRLTVDLENCRISSADGVSTGFTMDAFTRRCFMEGLDEIGLTLQHERDIADYERRRAPQFAFPA
jgi:3-isopropylmalate/(R)-2-methylmalate dehydratase small subunit